MNFTLSGTRCKGWIVEHFGPGSPGPGRSLAVGKSSEDVFALLGMHIALQKYQLVLVTHEC